MFKRLEVRVYQPTDTKGLRFRIIGLSNKYIGFDYSYNYVIDQALDLLSDHGYDSDNINDIKYIDKDNKYIILCERW